MLRREYLSLAVNVLTSSPKMQLPKKQKTYSQFLAKFLKSTSNLNIFLKTMTLTAHVFPK